MKQTNSTILYISMERKRRYIAQKTTYFGNCSQSLLKLYLSIVNGYYILYSQTERDVCLQGERKLTPSARWPESRIFPE